MILRKPYAFFIKHFKLIHVILAVLACYSVYRTKIILDFFNTYVSSIMSVAGQDLIGTLLYGMVYITPIFIILITGLVLGIMIFKKKPNFFYIINILVFIFVVVILFVASGVLSKLEIALVDVRTIRLVRDLLSVSFILQLLFAMIVIVRATGFNIKKFDFKKDLHDLKIEDKDREEFEVELSFDINETKRNVRKWLRKAKYVYKENKILILSIAGILIIGSGFLVYNNIIKKEPIINQNTYFYGNNFTMNITNSYLTNKDYKNKTINDDYYYLVLKLKIKNNTSKMVSLDVATAKILIGNYVYLPITSKRDDLFDFGSVYEGETIGNDYENKTLVYEIPKQIIKENMIFSFVDKTTLKTNEKFKRTKVIIKYEQFKDETEIKEHNLTETIDFKDTVLDGYNIKINSYDMAKSYKLQYNFCVNKECFPSYEVIKPNVASNYDKILLKINGSLNKNGNLKNIFDLYDFIDYFGYLKYEINGVSKMQNIKFEEVVSKKAHEKDIYYIEVLEEINKADKISLIFKNRGQNNEYILK
ncbi:MAG: hypothetical protein RSB71_00360 [Bacilli bacterium]